MVVGMPRGTKHDVSMKKKEEYFSVLSVLNATDPPRSLSGKAP
jgi:hypothetical protein